MSDWLLPPILIVTIVSVIPLWQAKDWPRLVSRVYMLLIFLVAALDAAGVINFDVGTRTFLLRCGWLSLVSVEVILWAKSIDWSRKLGRYGK